MKQKRYSIIPLFIFITVLKIKNYLLKYNISKKFFNVLVAKKENTVFLQDLILSIALTFVFALLIQFLINYFFKKFEIKIYYQKLKIELSKIYYSIFKFITLILFLASLTIIILNYSVFKTSFSSLNDSKLEELYYKQYKAVNLTHKKDSNNYLIDKNLYVFPEVESVIKIDIDTLAQDLPTSKDDGALNTIIKFDVNGVSLKTYATIKVQGTSTAYWPKKNWTIKLFKDRARKEEIKIKIGDSIFSDKWIAKADWNDPSLLRNYLSYSLWSDMVESRDSEIKYEVLNSNINNIGAQGFPRTSPVEINVNNEFYGLSLLLLGHDPDNFNIDKNNDKHLYFEFDSRGEGFEFDYFKTWEKFQSKGIGFWIDSYFPKDNNFSKDHKKAIDEFGSFIHSKQKDFNKNFNSYVDKDNIIDMLLFQEMVYDWDALAYDMEMVTYDLKKWYILPWDKDTTFGMFYDASGLLENTEYKLLFNYSKETKEQTLWFKAYKAYKKDVEKRYANLRDENVFTTENLIELIEDMYNMIPEELWNLEKNKWEPLGKVSTTETNKEQVIDWFTTRLKTLDKHFNYKKEQ